MGFRSFCVGGFAVPATVPDPHGQLGDAAGRLFDDEVAGRQHKHTILALNLFDRAVFALRRINQLEMDPHLVRRVVRPQQKRVVAQGLVGLDVVLVSIRPVELDLLTFVRNRIHALAVHAVAEEVAVGVIPPEEVVEVVIDLDFETADVHGICQPLAKRFHLRQRLGIGPQALRLLKCLLQFLLNLGPIGRAILRKRLTHLRQQILFQKRRNLRTPGVHNPIHAEVEVGPVELEQLLKLGLQSLKRLAHATVHRIVNNASTVVRPARRFSSWSTNWSRLVMISSSTLKISCR